MARNISPEGLRELFAQNSGHVFLTLLTIEHPTLSEPIRVVNDKKDLSYNGNTYTALSFDIVLPSDNEDKVPEIEIQFDNVGLVLTTLLRSVSDPPSVTIEFVRVDPSGVAHPELAPMQFSLLDANISTATVTLRLGYEIDILNEPATKDIFNPGTAPGLF